MDKKGLSDILPKDLSESSINEIAQIVNDTIEERVTEETSKLEAKVKAFIRLKIDELKEHALLELQEESEVYRNSKLFEHMKSVIALEIGSADKDSSVASLLEEKENSNKNYAEVADKLSAALEENDKLANVIETMNNNISMLEESIQVLEDDKEDLVGKIKRLNETSKKPFKSSEKAVIISENLSEVRKERKAENPFLTPEVMEYMPFTSKNK